MMKSKTTYSSTEANIYAVLIAASYVIVLYLVKQARVSAGERNRNNPDVVYNRMVMILVLSVFWMVAIPFYLVRVRGVYESTEECIELFGIIPGLHHGKFKLRYIWKYIRDCRNCMILIAVLFMGPLFNELFFESETVKDWYEDFCKSIKTLNGVRNYLFAPFTEELFYRSLIVVIYYPLLKTNLSVDLFIVWTPLLFGIAHLHHAYELYVEATYPLATIMISCLFQLAYTWLFGMLQMFVFLRNSNFWGITFIHAWCNWFGFPTFSIENQRWRYVYYCLLVVGLMLFNLLLFSLTKSELQIINWH